MDDERFLFYLNCKKFQVVLRSTVCSEYVWFQGYFKFVFRLLLGFFFNHIIETEPFKI